MKVLLASAAAAIGAIAALGLTWLAPLPSRDASTPPPAMPSAVLARAPPPAPAVPTPTIAARLRPALDVSEGASLRRRVERLLARGTPADRYRAFVVLARCAHALEFDRYLSALPASADADRLRTRYGDGAARIAAACGDLSARQVESRLELVASAADDGIPGAASAWIEEGPYGDRSALTQRPGDPLIVEWAEQAIARVHAAIKRADTDAISQFGLLCLNWELDDVARVRLLVDAALERRREDETKTVLN